MRARALEFSLGLWILTASTAAAATCDSLAALQLGDTSITSAGVVEAGAWRPPGVRPDAPVSKLIQDLPAFCRVQGTIRPSNDSHIEFEVWLPVADWNHKYLGIGNGGLAGYINYEMANALRLGYAGSSTDTGHRTADGKWWLGHPEKVTDFGYRAIHETAVKSKAIISAYYDAAPEKSYFEGCSNGGRQGLMEAQRYPADYDGIIVAAGAALKSSHIIAGYIWDVQALESSPAAYIPPAKIRAIERAVLAACDALDGVQDGVLDDPRNCRFDPDVLLCTGTEDENCLTRPQVAALKKLYAGPRNSKGEQIWPGLQPGGEGGRIGWTRWITGTGPGTGFRRDSLAGGDFLGFTFDYRSFDFDRDVKRMDDQVGGIYNLPELSLEAFKKRGGKLILYHGWSDVAVPPTASVDYYQALAARHGRTNLEAFARLYMVPGLQHCGGGTGPNSFDMLRAMEQWSEKGVAPRAIVATRFKIDGRPDSGAARTRPLCPYPEVARYSGSGSTDDAANFTCVAPPAR